MGGDAAADVPPAAAAAALSEPPSLESLAPELLSRVLDGPELRAAAGASRALRATLGDPRHDALKPRWAALALQLADPAASLALAERDARRSRADTPPAPTLLSAEEVTQVRVQDMWKKLQRVDRRSGWNIIVYDKPPPQRGPVGAWPAQVADSATSAGDAARPPLPPSTHAAEATATLARHAARLGSWPALLHALCSRNCIACGVVTRFMAWGPSNDEAACPSRGPARCCSDCALPGLRAGEQRSVALINTPFFDSSDAPPPAPVDATTFALRSRRNSACHDALAAAVNACPEGGTVDVSGMGWQTGRTRQWCRRGARRFGCAACRRHHARTGPCTRSAAWMMLMMSRAALRPSCRPRTPTPAPTPSLAPTACLSWSSRAAS